MTRLVFLPVLFVTLAACDEFAGDLEHLAFGTNLRVGTTAWTPEQGVAAGTAVQVFPGSILGRETQPEAPVVRGSVKGGVTSATAENCGNCVRFVGPARSRARVAYTVDGVYDEFRVKFEPATRFELLTEDGPATEVVAGGEVPFGALILDAWERPLGYDPQLLDVSATGPLSAWQDGYAIVIEGDGEPGEHGTVELTYAGRALGHTTLTIVAPSEVVP